MKLVGHTYIKKGYIVKKRNLLFIMHFYISCFAQQAVVVAPVVDLVGQPMANMDLCYQSLPVASNNLENCPRMHQLIFNEVVEIIKETDHEYCIRIPHLFYITHASNTPKCCYWTNKKHLMKFSNLPQAIHKFIPKPIDFKQRSTDCDTIVTLMKPFYSKQLQMTFSVGTRFIIKSKKRQYALVHALNPKTKNMVILQLPTSHYVASAQNPQKTYVKLLNDWANMPGYIPYVWGGCSLTQSNKTDEFKQKDSLFLINNDTQKQKNGFDCAGLIARAAQAAGMPYYYKNTLTLAKHLKQVKTKKDMVDGDLIWIPGHVMAIGNLKDNIVIEARHYNHGYGKVHKLPLHEIFKDIKTFDQLYDAIAIGQPLKRLHKDGHVVQTIRNAKILSMQSCYNHANKA